MMWPGSSVGAKMSAPSEKLSSQSKAPENGEAIWTFALAFYQRPGVQADCLVAQDTLGLDVTALIFALYCAHSGRRFEAGRAAELARTVSHSLVEPLRAARRALKMMPSQVDLESAQALRARIMENELDAERLVLDALMDLPETGLPQQGEDALLAIIDAYQTPRSAELLMLLKRLAVQADTM
jgi:uncharacterized protein (TIGR02444 family)